MSENSVIYAFNEKGELEKFMEATPEGKVIVYFDDGTTAEFGVKELLEGLEALGE